MLEMVAITDSDATAKHGRKNGLHQSVQALRLAVLTDSLEEQQSCEQMVHLLKHHGFGFLAES